MGLSDWLTNRFGTTDARTLLNEEVYSSESLKQDKRNLERKLSSLGDKLDEHQIRYEHFLHKGAEANDIEQQNFAQKARLEKKKHSVVKKKYKQTNIKLGTVISIEGMREISSMQQQQTYNLDQHLQAGFETNELQNQIMDQMAELGLNIEDMREIQDALDVEILDEQLEMDATEEVNLMEALETGDISQNSIQLEDATSTENSEPPLETNLGDNREQDSEVGREIEMDIEDEAELRSEIGLDEGVDIEAEIESDHLDLDSPNE